MVNVNSNVLEDDDTIFGEEFDKFKNSSPEMHKYTLSRNMMKKRQIDYHIHTETRNLSFIQTAKDLRDLGIEDNTFFLALYDKDLILVDPHDPNLSKEIKFKIITECTRNIYYFLRECSRIPDDGGMGKPYILNRANLAATFCFVHHIDHYLVIPRQKGKTQSTIANVLWAYLFGTSNTEMMFINKRAKDANNNLKRLKMQQDLLPSYMRFKSLITKEGKLRRAKDNTTEIVNPVTHNSIVTKPSANSEEAAEGIGRGCTQTVQYFDETEFTKHIKTIIQAAGPAYNTASSNAKRNNAAHCRIFTSTPGDLSSAPTKDMVSIIKEAAKWTEKMYDWTEDAIQLYIRKSSQNHITYIEYSYTQLGEDEEWFIKAAGTVLNDPIKIKREILLQRINGSNLSPFTLEQLDELIEIKKSPIETIFINTFCRLDVYEPLDKNTTYVVGVDCAAGVSSDNHACTVVHPYTGKPVAEFKISYLSTVDFAKFLHILIQKHIPMGILAIERNNVGIAIIDILRQTSSRSRIYQDDSKGAFKVDDKFDPHGFLKAESQERRTSGVWTGGDSRKLMFGILDEIMNESMDQIVTENITEDITNLVVKANQKVEHANGQHDDSLMSFLIARYVMAYSKVLGRYGFRRRPPKGYMNEYEKGKGLVEQDYDAEDKMKREHLNAITNLNQLENDDDLSAYASIIENTHQGNKSMSDIRRQEAEEMRQAELREMQLDAAMGVESSVQAYQVHTDRFGVEQNFSGNIPMSLFDELNG